MAKFFIVGLTVSRKKAKKKLAVKRNKMAIF